MLGFLYYTIPLKKTYYFITNYRLKYFANLVEAKDVPCCNERVVLRRPTFFMQFKLNQKHEKCTVVKSCHLWSIKIWNNVTKYKSIASQTLQNWMLLACNKQRLVYVWSNHYINTIQ